MSDLAFFAKCVLVVAMVLCVLAIVANVYMDRNEDDPD